MLSPLTNSNRNSHIAGGHNQRRAPGLKEADAVTGGARPAWGQDWCEGATYPPADMPPGRSLGQATGRCFVRCGARGHCVYPGFVPSGSGVGNPHIFVSPGTLTASYQSTALAADWCHPSNGKTVTYLPRIFRASSCSCRGRPGNCHLAGLENLDQTARSYAGTLKKL
jgi:hypothetical protein